MSCNAPGSVQYTTNSSPTDNVLILSWVRMTGNGHNKFLQSKILNFSNHLKKKDFELLSMEEFLKTFGTNACKIMNPIWEQQNHSLIQILETVEKEPLLKKRKNNNG